MRGRFSLSFRAAAAGLPQRYNEGRPHAFHAAESHVVSMTRNHFELA